MLALQVRPEWFVRYREVSRNLRTAELGLGKTLALPRDLAANWNLAVAPPLPPRALPVNRIEPALYADWLRFGVNRAWDRGADV